jgi:hypothetical protein
MKQIRVLVLCIVISCLTLGFNDGAVNIFCTTKAVASTPKKAPRQKPPPKNNQKKRKRIRFVPSGVGAPTSRSSAATRGNCDAKYLIKPQKNSDAKLIALIPENELSLTIEAVPAIAFYIPPGCVEEMRFDLVDTTTNQVYQTLLNPPSSAGIVNLKFSSLKNFSPLEIGKKYQWKLTLVADSRDPSADMNVSGFLQRKAVDVALAMKLKSATVNDRPSLYANYSLWLDTVATLFAARQASPEDIDLNADWNELMTSQGLTAILNQPLMSNLIAKMNKEPR